MSLIDASRARPKVRVVLRPEPDVDGAEQSCILPMGPDGGGYEGADDLGRRRRPPAGRSKWRVHNASAAAVCCTSRYSSRASCRRTGCRRRRRGPGLSDHVTDGDVIELPGGL